MKNTNNFFLLIILLISISITAQEKLKGNKDVTTTDRNISTFSKIEVIDDVDVVFSHNENQSVKVETDSNLQNSIYTEVNNGTLVIKTSNDIVRQKELTIHIKINKHLKEISAYNSAQIKSSNILIIDSLTINAFDKSDFNLKLNSKTVTLNTKKTSDLKLEVLSDETYITSEESSSLKGTIDTKIISINSLDKSSININGSSNSTYLATFGNSSFKGKDFKSDKALINATNSSDTYINAKKTIDIRAKNSSEVYLYSNPKITITEFFDKASLHKRD